MPAVCVTAAAAHDDLGYDVDSGVLDGFSEAIHDLLSDLELRTSIGADLLLGGNGLPDADARSLLGLCLDQDANLRRLLQAALVFRFALVLLHENGDLALGQPLLLLRARSGFAELAFFDGRPLLLAERRDLFFGDLAAERSCVNIVSMSRSLGALVGVPMRTSSCSSRLYTANLALISSPARC